jgi:hypothetical protein
MRHPGKEPWVPLRPRRSVKVGAWSEIMNESIDWKSAVAFSVKDPQKGVLIRGRCVALFAALVFANLPAMATAQSSSCPGIHMNILNIKNSARTVACALFDSPVGFPYRDRNLRIRVSGLYLYDQREGRRSRSHPHDG